MTTQNEISESRCKARKLIKKIYPDLTRNEIVHHIDQNPMNNDLSNLVIMDNGDHLCFHRGQVRKTLQDLFNDLDFTLKAYNTGYYNYSAFPRL